MKSRPIAMLGRGFSLWYAHEAARLAAALACYAILSVAPLMVLLVAIVAALFGDKISHSDTVAEVERLLGPSAATLMVNLIGGASAAPNQTAANGLATLLLLFGASGIFVELRSSLNLIWDVKEPESSWYAGLIKERLVAFAMVLGLGFVLTISLVLSTGAAVFARSFADGIPFMKVLLHATNAVVSFAVTGMAFCVVFRFVPATRIGWRDAAIGALITAALFDLSRIPLNLYLSDARVGSSYGAAGSLVAFLFWVYVSAQVFYLGAEFTRAYSEYYGGLSKALPQPRL